MTAPCLRLAALLPLLLLALVLAFSGQPARAEPALCDAAAVTAARETGVPLAVLRAITRIETGRSRDGRLEPWPWTLNRGGVGSWHASAAEALAAAREALAQGGGNLDIGCFQINHRWHADGFPSLAEMLDPVANARYAALFLVSLHAEFGDWPAAVGAYHSRSPAHADRYLARYRDVAAALGDAPPPRVGPRAPAALSLAARPGLFGDVAQPLAAAAVAPLGGLR